MTELWKHQVFGLEEIKRAKAAKINPVLLTSPTGGGKTRIMTEIASWGYPTSLYVDKRIQLDQLSERLNEAGISHGIRAAGFEPDFGMRVQLSMVQTDAARCFSGKPDWDLHRAEIAFMDEAHSCSAMQGQAIIDRHIKRNEFVVGFTATPVDLGGIYRKLIVAGTNSDLRECGAILPAVTYAPNEPDIPQPAGGKTDDLSIPNGRYSEKAIERAMVASSGSAGLFGNVFDHWKILNPGAAPAVGFASSVAASLGHAEHFCKQGVPAAHIDGEDCWINGEWYNSDSKAREQLREASRSGEIRIVWNRFVLREGVDWSWIYHSILGTIFSSVVSYLQAIGRGLRNDPNFDHVIIQDHGGNYWRHGSANDNRWWELGDTRRVLHEHRKHRMREKKDPEPIVCSKCFAVRTSGKQCPECGQKSRTSSRYVLQSNGKLREITGDIYSPKRYSLDTDLGVERWKRCYFAARNSECGQTFLQAMGWYARQYYTWPLLEWPLMPMDDLDLFNPVSEVCYTQLRRE